jgi:hypothetical protein
MERESQQPEKPAARSRCFWPAQVLAQQAAKGETALIAVPCFRSHR